MVQETRRQQEQNRLDLLCGDLRRVQAEFGPETSLHERNMLMQKLAELEALDPAELEESCCRMLGVCNGRTDFDTSNSLSWAADGSLCSNTASN
jgi:hypothetical protein